MPNWLNGNSKPSQLFEKQSQVKYLIKFKLRAAILIEGNKKKIRQKWLVKKSKFVWRKKNPPEQKYCTNFVSKVGTKKLHWNKCSVLIFFNVSFAPSCSGFRKKKQIIFAWCGFLFIQLSAIEMIIFKKKIAQMKISTSYAQIQKDILRSIIICKVMRVWKLPI